MSPEWNIDASTCAFPFRTWFIKDVGHATSPGDYETLSREIIHDNIDVFTYPTRPQFLRYDEVDDKLEILTAPEEKELTFFEKLLEILKKLMAFPRMIFEKLLEGKDITIIK